MPFARAWKSCLRSAPLLEPERLPLAKHRNGLAQSPLPGFFTLRHCNPAQISTLVRRRKRSKGLPRSSIFLQRFFNFAAHGGGRDTVARRTVDDRPSFRTALDAGGR